MKPTRLFLAMMLLALLFAADMLVTNADSHTVEVSALDSQFVAPAITVTEGTTVLWSNDGNAPHTVTGSDGSWDSGTLNSGDTYSFTFAEAGTYQYYCRFHGTADGSGMAAVVTVEASQSEVMPSITVQDQTISGRQVMISEVVAAQDGWLVIHDSNADGIVVPDIISEPVMVSAGTTSNVVATLTQDVPDNHTLYAMLHIDDGQIGVYEFPDADAPAFAGEDVVVVAFTVMLESMSVTPSITVQDQTISGRQVMISEVVAAQDGWLVIHDSNADGIVVPDIISEPVMVSAGTTSNVVATLTQDVPDNHTLYAMLHIDDGQIGVYEFPDADAPAFAGEDVVVVAFTVMLESTSVTPSITVQDQTISGRQVMISEVVAAQDGWLVIHNSDADGIVVPDIISEPVMVSAGTTSNVVATLTQDVPDNHTLYAMLHIDDGQIGVYEFPDADAPAFAGEDVVVVAFTVMLESTSVTPSITVRDQRMTGRQVVVSEVVAAQDGWLVIHNSDADGIVVPDIISEPVMVKAGSTRNVMVRLTQDVPNNHTLYAMLHIDDGQLGVYEFPDADAPAFAGEDVVVVPFTVSKSPPTSAGTLPQEELQRMQKVIDRVKVVLFD